MTARRREWHNRRLSAAAAAVDSELAQFRQEDVVDDVARAYCG